MKIVRILLVIGLFSSSVYGQKNKMIIQSGLINYFYDENPILLNSHPKPESPKQFFQNTLIKSVGIAYNRKLKKSSYLVFNFGKFLSFYSGNNKSLNNVDPEISERSWFIVSIGYNRNLINQRRFNLYYGGGIQYREGYEKYQIFDLSENTPPNFLKAPSVWKHERNDISLTFDLNISYRFFRNFILLSKLDAQIIAYDTGHDSFKELDSSYEKINFPKRFPINHTLTIGLGCEF